MILKLKDGDVKIKLFEDVAPNHVKRIKELAKNGRYDGVVFHRVIDGFMLLVSIKKKIKIIVFNLFIFFF